MELPRPASHDHGLRTGRSARTAGLAALLGGLALCLIAGCDSRVGIEGTDYSTDDPQPSASSATPTPTTSAAAAPALTPKPGELMVTVSLTKPDSDAADALTRWAMDLQTLPTDRLEDKCWTMAPQNVDSMYTDKRAILSALARPGVDDGTAITWTGPGRAPITIVAQRTDIDSGYACPRVFPAGTHPGFNDADARHTVRRYLDRLTGTPLNPADKESTHPLVCPAGPATWDPTGSGHPTAPPAALDVGMLGGLESFVDQAITSEAPRGAYIKVSAPVLTALGSQQDRTFTLKDGKQGYCIGAVAP